MAAKPKNRTALKWQQCNALEFRASLGPTRHIAVVLKNDTWTAYYVGPGEIVSVYDGREYSTDSAAKQAAIRWLKENPAYGKR